MLDFDIIVWPTLNRVSHTHYEFDIYSGVRVLSSKDLQKLSGSKDDL